MPNILFIASGDSMEKLGTAFKNSLPFPDSLIVINAYMEQALDYVRYHLPPGIDVIMARGNTARLLKSSHIPVPIVTIPIRDIELVQSITTASQLYGEDNSQIAYIGLEDVIQSVKGFLNLLHLKIRLYPVQKSSDIQDSILKAKRDQVSVVVGGIYTQQLAEEQGLKCVLLETSAESIREAYDRALEVQKGVLLQKKKLQERLIMMNSISNALVGLNEKGKINMFNTAAEQLFGFTEKEILGKSGYSLFSDAEQAIINRILLQGKEVTGHHGQIHARKYLLDFYPVLIKQKPRGIIINIKEPAMSTWTSGVSPTPAQDDAAIFQPSSPKLPPFLPLSGAHPAILAACALAEQYAHEAFPVLISGEDGVGKTGFARWIHSHSPRRNQLFLVQDAGQLTVEDMLSANHGSLYLKNIEQISGSMAALLREFLETGLIPLPNHTRQVVDVRILAGTCKPSVQLLPSCIRYQLSAFVLPVPALRQRPSDILLLAREILSAFGFPEETSFPPNQKSAQILTNFSWPGNLHQLESFCRRYAFFYTKNSGTDLIRQCLSEKLSFSQPGQEIFPTAECLAVAPVRKKGFVIHKKLITYEELRSLNQYYQGNKGLLAEKLGISRSTLWRYLKQMEEDSLS